MENLMLIVEISARHLHLSQEHADILFGKDYKFTPKKNLSQPGQFACEEKVRVEGPKGAFPGISVLGPIRSKTQIEISLADARVLGLSVPIRQSGNTDGTPGATLIGPNGTVELQEGVIVAMRHAHIIPKDAEKFDISHNEIVQVRVEGERGLVFDEVVARVSSSAGPAVHIDVDEGNAAKIGPKTMGEIIKKPGNKN